MSSAIEIAKETIRKAVDEGLRDIVGLSEFLHANPETAFEERRARERIESLARAAGLSVEPGIGGMETAFKAWRSYGTGSPVIAVLAEYDALPELGHACGHNLIAAMSTGAVIACDKALADSGLNGTIVLMGTPAEERGGGKGVLLGKGCFSGLDAAMMLHPAARTRVEDSSLASVRVILRYSGRSAHAAAAPWDGANALEAAIQTFNLVNAWRCQLREPSRINGIITNGGSAVNIIPEFAEAQFAVRAASGGYLDELVEKVRRCAVSAADGMGVSVEFERVGRGYEAISNNPVLRDTMAANLVALGLEISPMPRGAGMGSTDMGNVTQALPGLHCYIGVVEGIEPHTPEFAAACIGEDADRAIAAGAKALGMTAMDLFASPDLVSETRAAFLRR